VVVRVEVGKLTVPITMAVQVVDKEELLVVVVVVLDKEPRGKEIMAVQELMPTGLALPLVVVAEEQVRLEQMVLEEQQEMVGWVWLIQYQVHLFITQAAAVVELIVVLVELEVMAVVEMEQVAAEQQQELELQTLVEVVVLEDTRLTITVVLAAPVS